MKKWFYGVPVIAVAILAACSADTVVRPNSMVRLPVGPAHVIQSAVNTNAYDVGTQACSVVNGNQYVSALTVGLNGSPSGLGSGPYYILVESPGANPGEPSTPLGMTVGAVVVAGKINKLRIHGDWL
jgi:hypothetical protein